MTDGVFIEQCDFIVNQVQFNDHLASEPITPTMVRSHAVSQAAAWSVDSMFDPHEVGV